MGTSNYFSLTICSKAKEQNNDDQKEETLHDATYTRSKNASKDNDPKLNAEIRKEVGIRDITDNGYITYDLYWIIKEVSSEKENDDDKNKVDIPYKYVILKKNVKTITFEEGLTSDATNATHTLKRLTFNRELYKPNEIVADIVFAQEPTTDELNGYLGKRALLTCYAKDDSTGTTEKKDTFEGFYVYDILPIKSAGNSLCVRFHIFSLDHQLTLRKYSRTYVAKKLFADIILEGIDTNSNTDYTTASPKYNTQPVKLERLIHTYYGKKEKENDKTLTDFDHLKYSFEVQDNNNSTATHTYERIQPYLVQFNESFHAFLSRTANRCGEFLFWDECALRLGRTCNPTGLDDIDTGNCLTIYYSAVNDPEEKDSKFDTLYQTIDDENLSFSSVPDLNKDIDSKFGNPAQENEEYYCTAEHNTEVYNTRLYKDRFASYTDENYNNATKFWLTLLSTALNETTMFDFIKKTGTSQIVSWAAAAATAKSLNDFQNKTHFDDDGRPNLNERNNDSGKDKYIHPFAGKMTEGHLNATFYEKIRLNEEKLTRELITFNLKVAGKMRLGQVIHYKSKPYIITQIKMGELGNGSTFTAIDGKCEEPFADMPGVMQVVAIPPVIIETPETDSNGGTKTTYSISEIYPPLAVNHVRRSEPQVAFIDTSLDPQKRGRVRIVYPWQTKNDLEASPWIKVLSPSSTKGGGCTFPLGKGDEVLIDYEGGNVERPYVAGTLFNRGNTTPYRRGNMALVSRNGHAIGFSDPFDTTNFLGGVSPAYKFLRQFIPKGIKDDNPALLKLTGGITLSDAYGFYKIQMSTDQRRIDIASPFGSVNLNAFTGITISAPNGDINIKGQNVNIEAGNAVKITSGTNILKKGWLGFNHSDEDGKWDGFITGLGEGLLTGLTDTLKTAAQIVDLDLLRKLIQVFLRPIDGTLEIKSNQYLLLEAGKGEATVERDRYRKVTDKDDTLSSNNFKNIAKKTTYSEATRKIRSTAGLINLMIQIDTTVNTVFNDIKSKNGELFNAANAYNSVWPNQQLFSEGKDKDAIINEAKNSDNVETYQAVAHDGNGDFKLMQNFNDQDQAQKNARDTIIHGANELASKAHAYYKATRKIKDELDGILNPLNVNDNDPQTLYYNYLKNSTNKVPEFVTRLNYDWNVLSDPNQDNPTFNQLKQRIKRLWFYEVFTNKEDDILISNKQLNDQDNDWADFVNGIDKLTLKQRSDKLAAKAFSGILTQYSDAFTETFLDRNHWKADNPGQIIYSDQPGISYYIDATGNKKEYINGSTAQPQDHDLSVNHLKEILNRH